MLNQPQLVSSRQGLRRCKIPFLFDTVDENVRSRVLFPLAVLGLYILLVFAVIGVSETVKPSVN